MKKVEKRLCHGVLALFKVIDGHATQNIFKRQCYLTNGLTSPPFHTSLRPSLLYYGTSKPSSIGTPMKRLINKCEMLHSQSRNFTTIVRKLKTNAHDQENLFKQKVDVGREKRNTFKISNLKVWSDYKCKIQG